MLTANAIFSIAGTITLPCWIALALSVLVPQTRNRIWAVTGIIVPAIFAIAYVVLIRAGFVEAPHGGFGSIAQVRDLLASDAALVAGWLHYLAFDLFVGTWIVRTGLAERLPKLLVLICLPATFLFGPAGLLIFIVVRFIGVRARAVEVDTL